MKRRNFLVGLSGLAATAASPVAVAADALLRAPRARRRAAVAVVGSGPAGLAVADMLSARGLEVMVLESGGYRPGPHQDLARVLPAGEAGLPFDAAFASQRVVGGSTVYWAGYSPRFVAADLEGRPEWPVRWSSLEDGYCAAERWLRVKSAAGCGRPWSPPFNERSRRLGDALAEVGIDGAVPTPIASVDDAAHEPLRLNRHVAPALTRRGRLRLVTGATVRRIRVNGNGRAAGVSAVSDGGREFDVTAERVVLAGGAVQNARLLLLGAGRRAPHGLGNHAGLVGRCFMEHPHVRGWLDAETGPLPGIVRQPGQVHWRGWDGPARAAGNGGMLARIEAFPVVPEHAFTEERPRGRLLFDVLCEQEPRPENGIELAANGRQDRFGDPLPVLRFALSPRDRATLDRARRRLEGVADRLDAACHLEQVAYGSHLMGTTRMGEDPEASVVDPHQQIHGVPGLYLSGASVFPSGGAANPTLTLTALSLRLARHLLGG